MNIVLGPIRDQEHIGLQTTKQDRGEGGQEKIVLVLETMDTAGLVSTVGTGMSV